MSKKRICLLAVGLTLLLAAGFFLALPRTLFDEPFSATVWSRDGRLLSAKVAPDGQWRFFPTDSVPGKFRTAITTYEDKRFDRHFGVDPLALARAVGQNLAAGRIESGASTLTMQTIRLSRGGKPRTFGEKFVEAVLALRLEMRCSKEEILALYAAHAPFGGNVVGLESASWYYFGRSAAQLSWAECAMLAVLPEPRETRRDTAPRIETIHIPVDKIRDVIGSGGKVVRGIQDETGAQIDIQEDGTIHIAAIEGPAGEAAKAMILGIVKEPEVGEIFEGEVVGIKDFGAFVKLTPGKDGLLHISRVANGRVGSVEDVLQLGDTVKVQVLEIDPKTGKISLDRLDKPEAPEGSAPAPHEHRGHDRHERHEGGKREGGQRDVRPGRANRTPRRRHESQ